MQPLGDIAAAADDADDRPRFIADRGGAGQPPGSRGLVLALRFEAVEQGLPGGDDLLLIGEVPAGQRLGEEVEVGLAERFIRVGDTKRVGGRWIEAEKAGVDIFDVEGIRHVIHHRPQQVALASQGDLGFFAGGDVLNVGDEVLRRAISDRTNETRTCAQTTLAVATEIAFLQLVACRARR